ncbi:DUF3570 domain-containing protein [Methylomonas sp. AM2-LC]|uniref:DUF3570 domain-containing protein n=1 Tax=Methylomonas sp. AM2-LC TaxID=3153301 RepID=UPI003265D75E
MVVTKKPTALPINKVPRLLTQVAACRAALAQSLVRAPANTHKPKPKALIKVLCLSALTLPGMLSQAHADTDEDEVGYQFSHYEEGKRPLYAPGQTTDSQGDTFSNGKRVPFTNQYQPLTANSEHGFTRFRLNDRVRFAFNYNHDVWSGATPMNTMPLAVGGFGPSTLGTASPSYEAMQQYQFFDAQGHFLRQDSYNYLLNPDGSVSGIAPGKLVRDNRLQHLLGYASPESRHQIDMKLGYDWDNAALDMGAGTSNEPDYQSNFANLNTKLEFNQKQTAVNLGLSYTSSDTHAYNQSWTNYNLMNPAYTLTPGRLNANRRDVAITLAFSQVMNKNDVFNAGFSYTRSTGFQSNPYKSVSMFVLDPNWRTDGLSYYNVNSNTLPGVQMSILGDWVAEQRPELRNQFTWDGSFLHYMPAVNAAAKLGYSYFRDDWGISSHTFDGEWRQDLGGSWLLTPHVRYYSQSAASFYAPYFFTYCSPINGCPNGGIDSSTVINTPKNYSSDQRLSAYGTLSGGVSLAKQFAKGLSMELGFEYYTHNSALKMGGGGSGDYTDFHSYTVNAALHANLGKLKLVSTLFDSGSMLEGWFDDSTAPTEHANHSAHHSHNPTPAGVMFAHMQDQPGEWMLGYRFMQSDVGGDLLHGSQKVDFAQVQNTACPKQHGSVGLSVFSTATCLMPPGKMSMNMHMLDLMYAPTDWLNLMLMPQFVDMSMKMDMSLMTSQMMMMMGGGMETWTGRDHQQSGGFGDTGAYMLFRLFDGDGHHVHLTQGISIPTGTINTRYEWNSFNYYSYDMQSGSGTWDYKPSLTYTGEQDDWFWGGQFSGTHRLQAVSSHGWALGDLWQGTAWGGYHLTDWLSSTVRGVYTAQSAINGQYLNGGALGVSTWANMPNQYPQNYGGSYADVGVGLSATIPKGNFAGNTFGFEWLQPVYTYVNGYQADRVGALSASWSYAF